MGFLARWARRLSWRETAEVFQTSWEAIYRSVQWFVDWGLAHRTLSGVEATGVDEIHWGHGLKANNFLTVISHIDAGCRRLLWIGRRSCERTLRRGVNGLDKEFRARGELSSASVEDLNSKCRAVTRRSCGFCTDNGIEVALDRTLGRVPRPETIHRFC